MVLKATKGTKDTICLLTAAHVAFSESRPCDMGEPFPEDQFRPTKPYIGNESNNQTFDLSIPAPTDTAATQHIYRNWPAPSVAERQEWLTRAQQLVKEEANQPFGHVVACSGFGEAKDWALVVPNSPDKLRHVNEVRDTTHVCLSTALT